VTLSSNARTAFSGQAAPRVLHSDESMKVMLVSLEPGERIAPHPEENRAVFSVLAGKGVVCTDEGDRFVEAGAVVEVPFGAVRGMRAADERLVVLATAVF